MPLFKSKKAYLTVPVTNRETILTPDDKGKMAKTYKDSQSASAIDLSNPVKIHLGTSTGPLLAELYFDPKLGGLVLIAASPKHEMIVIKTLGSKHKGSSVLVKQS